MATLTTNVSGSRVYLAPYIAGMTATNSGTVNTLGNVTVTISGVDQSFEYFATPQESIDLLNSFEVLDISNGSVADISLNFKPASASTFVDIVAKGVNTAVNVGNESVTTWLANSFGGDVTTLLQSNDLLDLLEANDLSGSFTIALDVSGGAIDLKDRFIADSDGTLKALFLQIPKADIDLYKSSLDLNTTTLGFLPMVNSSKMTFVFDVSATNVIDYYNTDITIGESVTPSGTGYAPLGPQALSGSSQRRIAVGIVVSNGGSAGDAMVVTGTLNNYTLSL